jgi:alanyl-tRNA synthetase
VTKRIYYDDAHQTRFEAGVVESLKWEGQPAVVLDRTAFYPTGGGQPHDAGTLNDVQVMKVVERESDGAVVHVLSEALVGPEIAGVVDWGRRFDLMQQHTGQHILSAAFIEELGANTIGFHLSDEYSTIDLDRAPISVEELARTEWRANAVVFENQPVVSRFVPDDEVASLPLRKELRHKGPIRVVEVGSFDCCACGGTHVQAAGAVGLIKITTTERRGSETRVEFLCGRRALADYAAKNALLMGLAQEYTVGHWEVADMVHRLDDELKQTRRELRRSRDALLDAEADGLWRSVRTLAGGPIPEEDPVQVVQAGFDGRSMDDLKHLAQRLIAHSRTVALLASGGKAAKGYLVFARSDDLEMNMGALLREASSAIGGRGGGRPNFAQGGGPEDCDVAQALEVAFARLAELVAADSRL